MAGRGTRSLGFSRGFGLLAAIAALALSVPASASADAQPRIVGGVQSSIDQFPWQVRAQLNATA
jgi:hypothetical protein